MPFNEAPSNFFGAGYSLVSSEVKLTTADNGGTVLLGKLTDAQANATTGDARDVSRAFCYALYEKYSALSSGNRPTKMRMNKDIVALAPTTDDPQVLRETYTFSFDVLSDPQGVIDEP